MAKMTGQEKEVIVDAEELAAQEAALTKAEEEERIAASETDKWEVPDEEEEEEPLPEIEPLPKEAAEGSRYPKLTKAKTGRLKDAPLTGHIVPHTHWDRAWYLPFQKYRYRLVELVDDLLDLMENNPLRIQPLNWMVKPSSWRIILKSNLKMQIELKNWSKKGD
ncbi:MAG: hypothetical protein Ct9H90mP16_19470 [Candidatus Poseidoniales archaeon]|nr:MAG: hypothetical protein Ct9H90mP16_19470 [Candidatus Poseidoniales archaeon]